MPSLRHNTQEVVRAVVRLAFADEEEGIPLSDRARTSGRAIVERLGVTDAGFHDPRTPAFYHERLRRIYRQVRYLANFLRFG
jgi:hypothetical protein